MAGTRGIRNVAIDTAVAVADRLGPDTHEVEVDGLVIGGSLADNGTYLRSLSGPLASSYELELFKEAVGPGMTVLDCGAHLGLQTLVAARAVGAEGTVIAVEAAPPTAAALRRNVRANGFDERVEVVEAAAVAESGTVRLHQHPWPDRSGVADAASESAREVDVPGVRLDDILGERRFEIAKIDVEGAEAETIGGLEHGIERSSGATVFLECHPERLSALGTDPVAWLEEVAGRGRLELIDEETRSLLPLAGRPEIERAVEEHSENFNTRWSPAG